MSEPKDPLLFDFGIGFKSAAERVKGEAAERVERGKSELEYGHSFLDDLLRGIAPNDLIVIGAETGAGKTEFARNIAAINAKKRRRVYYFALEAEERELERRTKYAVIQDLLFRHRVERRKEVNYPDWYRGKCEDIIGSQIDTEAENAINIEYGTLNTYYRGSKFDHDDIRRLFLAIQTDADLIVLDHLHYVDIEDENENRGFKKTVKMIRDVALGIGKPVILVVHLRKRDMRSKAIVPDIEMIHGSSDIAKICTRAVMIAPARSMPSKDPGYSNTFFYVPKDRVGGATGLVAMCAFDQRFKKYSQQYTLGRASFDSSEFEPLDAEDIPQWAKRATRPTQSQSSHWGEQ
jgi:nucleoside-triphosphatase THEP1